MFQRSLQFAQSVFYLIYFQFLARCVCVVGLDWRPRGAGARRRIDFPFVVPRRCALVRRLRLGRRRRRRRRACNDFNFDAATPRRPSLTEPRLLLALHLDGQPEVGQLHGGALRLARQQQVLRLRFKKKSAKNQFQTGKLENESLTEKRRVLIARGGAMTHLEIPVNDAVLVAVIDALQDLLDAVRRVRLAVELARHDVLEQLAARHPALRFVADR